MDEFINIRGARVHNLKNISVSIPHNQITVVTGVSGSGKSSLAFDTIYAEGQRRYVESMSAYARQFLERMEKPDVDEIDGIAPAVAIRQKNSTRNPRSTVATATETYDFLRLLYARIGVTYCPICGERVERDTVDRAAERILALPEGSRWYVLFPVRTEADLKAHLFELRKRGFAKLFQEGRTFEFSTPESLLEIDFTQPVYVLADRIAITEGLRERIVDTIEICYREAAEAILLAPDGSAKHRFSERFTCPSAHLEFREPEPNLFSFNSPAGACPRCQGFGQTIDFDMDRVIPNTSLSVGEDAVEPWGKPKGREWFREFSRRNPKAFRAHVSICDLTEAERNALYDAIREFFAYFETRKYKLHVRVMLSKYRGYTQCPECQGQRLRKDALYVRVNEKTIGSAVKLNIAQAADFFNTLTLTPEETGIAEKILVEIQQRLRFLNNVGLEYLTLDRLASTLSGGEAQRIQLATSLGSRLVGACYVLDEPSIGLHTRDTDRLIRILKDLRDLGNTIVVVEHDPEVMREADHILDMGPGAGELGGKVIFEGTFPELLANGNGSLTGKYLTGELRVSVPRELRTPDRNKMLRFFGARLHNLKGVDVEIPLGLMVVVTGVSGSGKSTLVHDVIYRALHRPITAMGTTDEDDPAEPKKLNCTRVEGASRVGEIVMIDQTPIGRTPRSNPVTYIKAFDMIRSLFASTRDAEKRGYTSGHFSFNIPGGRCEVCQGDGTVTVEMQFLADVELVCEECRGTRYKATILEIKYKDKNIHDVLGMTVRDAMAFFSDTPKLAAKLKVLDDVGLGYLRLGQSATTLSGGEAQRVKLAGHLAQASSHGTLYICDEPTTGLHFDDIAKLLIAFERLLDQGGSLLVIEHNLDVIRAADWVIDMGPDGGDAGGRVVATGTPEDIAQVAESHTGRYLKRDRLN